MKTQLPIRYLACLLMVAAFFSSTRAVAEDTIPFKTMMQSASVDAAMPPKPDANDGLTTTSKHANGGKAERVTGGILLGGGVAAITTTVVVVSMLHGSFGHTGRVWAGIGGGAAMTGAGITLIVLGSHKTPSN